MGLKLLVALLFATTARADSGPTEVVVLKRAGVTAYEEVAEEFGERCRVRARVISFGDEGPQAARSRIGSSALLVTVGQEAFDAVRDGVNRVIPTLAFHTEGNQYGPPVAPPPELLLKVLTSARPLKKIAAVFGSRARGSAAAAQKAADRLGLELRAVQVPGGPEAVRALHKLVGEGVQAIWLLPDADVITPQVFQYALTLQLQRGLPVVAATRQQVHSGALLAVDFPPRASGHAAAQVVNRLLDGRAGGKPDHEDMELFGGATITVNGEAARRLGADLAALDRMGAKIE
jgi:hypothetical protein